MTKRIRTLSEAYAANAAYCAEHGHSWIAGRQCSWCGARRQESFGEAMQRLQTLTGTTQEELNTLQKALLDMAEPEEA